MQFIQSVNSDGLNIVVFDGFTKYCWNHEKIILSTITPFNCQVNMIFAVFDPSLLTSCFSVKSSWTKSVVLVDGPPASLVSFSLNHPISAQK